MSLIDYNPVYSPDLSNIQIKDIEEEDFLTKEQNSNELFDDDYYNRMTSDEIEDLND